MANALYGKGRGRFAGHASSGGQINWLNDTINCALVSSSYTAVIDGHEFVNPDMGASLQHIITSGTLTSKTVVTGVVDASDITFSAVTAGAIVQYVVLMKNTGSPLNSPLIALLDTVTGLPLTASGADITVQWSAGANAIFKL